MNSTTTPPPRFLGLPAETIVALLLGVLALFRFFYCQWLYILPDETYYWQWSRHLDASYFSKGPAIAYTIAAGTALWGDNNFGIRFFSVLLSAGTGWQVFLLARRWYDETTAVIAVLLAGVIPLYAIGSVLMTIDPLSAFFWIWAANLFSQALQRNRMSDWLWTGFAVGSGFLAKYTNALELLAFLVFLLLVPARRHQLVSGRFWAMLAMTLFCTLPVWWWNAIHHWPTVGQLADRGHLNGPFTLQFSTFFDFMKMQAVVISPLLFITLLIVAGRVMTVRWRNPKARENEGELLLLILFFSVFLLYAFLSLHLKCEANWPALSYLTLIILLAARWREILQGSGGRPWIIAVFLVAWIETILLHDTGFFHLSLHKDPSSRAYGWEEVTPPLDKLRKQYQADLLITNAYREASMFSYYLPDHPNIYVVKHVPPANQFDFWPDYPREAPHRALMITGNNSASEVAGQFNTITFVGHIVVSIRGEPFRTYSVYLCENK